MNQEAMWSARYRDAGSDYLFGAAPNRFLADHRLQFQPGQRALVVADSEGRNSVWLAGLGLDVCASDISPIGLDKARKLAHVRDVKVHGGRHARRRLAADRVSRRIRLDASASSSSSRGRTNAHANSTQ